jgi:serine/threonine protein kinase
MSDPLLEGLEALEQAFPHPAGHWPEVSQHLDAWVAGRAELSAEEHERLREELDEGARAWVSSFEELGPGIIYLGRYEVLHGLGPGPSSRVYVARDLRLGGRRVVLKRVELDASILRAADTVDEAWLSEAKAQAAVPHVSVVPLHEAHRTATGAILVMQFVHRAAEESQPAMTGLHVRLSERQAVNAAAQLAHVLMVAHQQGITHGDVTPNNVAFVDALQDGTITNPDVVRFRLFDFGFATPGHLAQPLHSRTRSQIEVALNGSVLERRVRAGTPGFMAPERTRYARTPWSGVLVQTEDDLAARKRGDVFEVISALHFWLTGQTVWDRALDFDDVWAQREHPRNQVSNPRLKRLVERGLHGGYPGAKELFEDLSAWLERQPMSCDEPAARLIIEASHRCPRWPATLSFDGVWNGPPASRRYATVVEQARRQGYRSAEDLSRDLVAVANQGPTSLNHGAAWLFWTGWRRRVWLGTAVFALTLAAAAWTVDDAHRQRAAALAGRDDAERARAVAEEARAEGEQARQKAEEERKRAEVESQKAEAESKALSRAFAEGEKKSAAQKALLDERFAALQRDSKATNAGWTAYVANLVAANTETSRQDRERYEHRLAEALSKAASDAAAARAAHDQAVTALNGKLGVLAAQLEAKEEKNRALRSELEHLKASLSIPDAGVPSLVNAVHDAGLDGGPLSAVDRATAPPAGPSPSERPSTL